jgi:SAM-dependent methyltransferase
MSSNVERFSTRVENYVKYRPGYPPEVLGLLRAECGLTGESVVADVGSGTGILSEMFLKHGNRVYGVEPNREMREAGARLLEAYENFVSVEGRAEATTLDSSSVDFVTAGQAMHWFEREGARREFARVLREGGWVVVLWNERLTGGTPFLEAYERLLLDYGTDYREVSHNYAESSLIEPFFGAGRFRLKAFANRQVFDLDGLRGRLLSASYVPEPGHPGFQPMMRALVTLFDQHAVDSKVSVEYETKVYYGQLK